MPTIPTLTLPRTLGPGDSHYEDLQSKFSWEQVKPSSCPKPALSAPTLSTEAKEWGTADKSSGWHEVSPAPPGRLA